MDTLLKRMGTISNYRIYKNYFMRSMIAILILLVGMSSCHTGKVLVRLKNSSAEDFRRLTVNVSGQEYSFENIKPGEVRKLKVDSTYSYFPITLITSSDTLRSMPIDYVGERLRKSGKLDMNINIRQGADRRMINFQTKWSDESK